MDGAIRFSCRKCGAHLEAEFDYQGELAQCQKCGAPVRVPPAPPSLDGNCPCPPPPPPPPPPELKARRARLLWGGVIAAVLAFVGTLAFLGLRGCQGGEGGHGGKGDLGAAWKGDEGDGTGSLVPGAGGGPTQGDAKGVGDGGEEAKQATAASQTPAENGPERKETAVAEAPVPARPARPAEIAAVVLYEPVNQEGVQPQEVPVQEAPVQDFPLQPAAEAGGGGVPGTRGSSAAREGALRQFGGSRAGEESVLKALRWLKRTQAEDGSWTDQGAPVAMTGVGLLCFLAHGETPQSKEFGDTVRRAISYLREAVQAGGTFDPQKGRSGCAYTHAMGAYGLAEAFGITRDKGLKRVAESTLAVIVKGQNGAGGWDYHYGDSRRNDTSVMGWQVQALKAAKLAGLSVSGLDAALGHASKVFKQHYQGADGGKKSLGGKERGSFGYTGSEANNANMTGVGTLCRPFSSARSAGWLGDH